jgi:hypothetical protein
MRELEKIKKERQAQKEKEVCTVEPSRHSAHTLMLRRNKSGPPRKKSSAKSISPGATLCSTRKIST